MNIALSREATADRSREAYPKTNGQFDALTLDAAFLEAVRELAKKSVAQTRKAFDHSKNALEAAVDTMARSFVALSHGSAALNRKVIEIAQQNVSSGFDLAKSMARSQYPRRNSGVTGDLLAQPVQRTRNSSRGTPRVVRRGGSRHGRASQDACDAQPRTACRFEHCC